MASLLLAGAYRHVLELGGYKGACSRVLAETLRITGGGSLTVVEYDPVLAQGLRERISSHDGVDITILEMDSLVALDGLPPESIGFAWVDDSHDTPHVAEELNRLLPAMIDGGIICFHDVHGHYNLRTLVEALGGVALDLPKVSSSGGLGILQVTDRNRHARFRISEIGSLKETGEKVLAGLVPYHGFDGEYAHWVARDTVG